MATSADAPAILARGDGASIAYHRTDGDVPGVMFLGGFMSDMTGTKATALEAHCRDTGRAYLRFDYTGHGQSSGDFTDGTIGQWAGDAIAALDALTDGPQVLVGSSMGGWLMLLTALARPKRVVGLVGLAAAPDFTEDLMWRRFGPDIRETLARDGAYHEPSAYSESPYPITMRLIEEGREHLLLDRPIAIHCPVRLIHGMKDVDVPWMTAQRLADRLLTDDVSIHVIKDGDHRLSTERDIAIICHHVDRLCEMAEGD